METEERPRLKLIERNAERALQLEKAEQRLDELASEFETVDAEVTKITSVLRNGPALLNNHLLPKLQAIRREQAIIVASMSIPKGR